LPFFVVENRDFFTFFTRIVKSKGFALSEPDHERDFKQEGDLQSVPRRTVPDNPLSYVSTRARIAIYDDLLSAPRIVDVDPAPIVDFIEDIASTTYEYAQKQGGRLPYTVIREMAENFIHAQFRECAVSILDKGNTIRFSDQGPGIEKKRLVQQPGITSATAEMKRFIRGVGSGFPIVKEYLEHQSGFLSIDDNAKEGVVVTLSIQPASSELPFPLSSDSHQKTTEPLHALEDLDERSVRVLHLLYDKGILGVSDLTGPLGVSGATAHRILAKLEQKGFIESTAQRKRILSNAGFAYLEAKDQRD
jgi:hypothetical protein